MKKEKIGGNKKDEILLHTITTFQKLEEEEKDRLLSLSLTPPSKNGSHSKAPESYK